MQGCTKCYFVCLKVKALQNFLNIDFLRYYILVVFQLFPHSLTAEVSGVFMVNKQVRVTGGDQKLIFIVIL